MFTPVLVAVYGSLKAGFGNNSLLKGYGEIPDAEFLGEHIVDGRFYMRSLGGFPAIFEANEVAEATPITCEIYRVASATMLANLDGLEGHPNWYERKLIPTEWGMAWVYVMPNGEYEDCPVVEDGVWRGYRMNNIRTA